MKSILVVAVVAGVAAGLVIGVESDTRAGDGGTTVPPAPGAGQAVPVGAPGFRVSIDFETTPAKTSGGVRGWKVTSGHEGVLDVHLRGSMLGPPDKSGEVLFDLAKSQLAKVPWGNRSHVEALVRVAPAYVGVGKRNWYRAHRARLFIVDKKGRRLYLPNASIVDRPKSTEGWLPLAGSPSADVPAPIGFIDAGFDPGAVTGLGVNVEAFNREGETVEGPIELRDLVVTFAPPVTPRLLATVPAIRAEEGARAARMEARLAERCGLAKGAMAVGVNLAWPSVPSPTGEAMQLYGRIIDGGTKWWDKFWDVGEPDVAASVRTDFAEIRDTFGPGAVVRVWLLGDLRSGITFDAAQDPVAVTERARANMKVLLDLAVAEKVVLIPVLLDFGLADGVAATGPDFSWHVGERPDLITDARKRGKLVAALEAFIKPFADHPGLLAWDVMNEPENAVAVVTPGSFADLQALLAELVDAVHRTGAMATIGHHNVIDPTEFFRGRVATDLGQVHYYPFLETRRNPTPFSARLTPTFGPLPAGWGEAQTRPGQIAGQFRAARAAGHKLFMFWSWRGHQETGDGFAVKPYAAEIKRALAELRGKRAEAAPAGKPASANPSTP